MTTTKSAQARVRRSSRTSTARTSQAEKTQLQQRAQRWIKTEISFVPNAEFAAEGRPRDWDLEALRGWRVDLGQSSDDGIVEETEVSRLCDTDLLNSAQEVRLFRTMNQLKYGANVLRSRLSVSRPSRAALDRIEAFMDEAEQIRNHIVQANVRLVISIVKRLTGPQHSFDEFVSDGMLSLMQVVEKFDFDRGFRFSTYAYRAITRTVYRKMAHVHKQDSRMATGVDEALHDVPNRSELSLPEQTWMNLRELLGHFIQELDGREQRIIHARYALGDTSRSQTFQSLADELGVSKERVRQLERRAVGKLQALAAQVDLDQYIEASLA